MKWLKISFATILTLIFLLSLHSLCWAADNPGDKLSRGVVNIISAPLEIAKQIDKEWKNQTDKTKKVSLGLFGGFFKGITYTVGRMGSGVWDVVTCPFQLPKGYEPLMKPDYVLDKKSPPPQQNQLNQEINK